MTAMPGYGIPAIQRLDEYIKRQAAKTPHITVMQILLEKVAEEADGANLLAPDTSMGEIVEMWLSEHDNYNALICINKCCCHITHLAPCGYLRPYCIAGHVESWASHAGPGTYMNISTAHFAAPGPDRRGREQRQKDRHE